MMLAVTDRLGGVDIPINAAARPDTGALAGIDAFDDSEYSEQDPVFARRSGRRRPGPAGTGLPMPGTTGLRAM